MPILRIIQTVHTFLVEARDMKEAQAMVSDSIHIDPVSGVTVAQRQLKAGDPFEFETEQARDLLEHQQARLAGAAPRGQA